MPLDSVIADLLFESHSGSCQPMSACQVRGRGFFAGLYWLKSKVFPIDWFPEPLAFRRWLGLVDPSRVSRGSTPPNTNR